MCDIWCNVKFNNMRDTRLSDKGRIVFLFACQYYLAMLCIISNSTPEGNYSTMSNSDENENDNKTKLDTRELVYLHLCCTALR